MFRISYENIHIAYWVFTILVSLSIVAFFIIGVIVKKRGVSLKFLLIGEEFFFTILSSIIAFLTLEFFVAFFMWILICLLMPLIYKNNNKIINFLNYCKQNENSLNKQQSIMFSRLNCRVNSANAISWVRDYLYLKKEILNRMDNECNIKNLKFKYKFRWFYVLTSGILSISMVFLIYGNLFGSSNSFFILLIENYAILSCILFVLYFLLYFGLVKNPLHYMYESERLYKLLFALFSVIMYTVVTLISII